MSLKMGGLKDYLDWACQLDKDINWDRPKGPSWKPMTFETAWFTTGSPGTAYSYGDTLATIVIAYTG